MARNSKMGLSKLYSTLGFVALTGKASATGQARFFLAVAVTSPSYWNTSGKTFLLANYMLCALAANGCCSSCEWPTYFDDRTCPKTDPRFKPLVQRVTQNFDTFEDYGSPLDNSDGKTRVQKNTLDQFYNYGYRRVRKPRVPLPDLPP
jgi:hypothetical protein